MNGQIIKKILLWGGNPIEDDYSPITHAALCCKMFAEIRYNFNISMSGDNDFGYALREAINNPPDIHFVMLNNVIYSRTIAEKMRDASAIKWGNSLNETEKLYAGLLLNVQDVAQVPVIVFSGVDLTETFHKIVSEFLLATGKIWPVPCDLKRMFDAVFKLLSTGNQTESSYR